MIVWEEHPSVGVHDVLAEVAFEYPGVPQDVLAAMAVSAAIEACREADLVRRSCELLTQPRVETYLLAPQDDTEVVAILDARRLEGSDMTRVLRRYPSEPSGPFRGEALWYDAPARTVHLVSRSAHRGRYRLDYSVSPRPGAATLPAQFAGAHAPLIRDGVRARVHAQPGREWSDPRLSALFGRRFRDGYRAAKVERMRGGQRGASRVRHGRVL
jgi:hypothetical protein